ncbi:MAG: AbrB/MazE/SpoVT family DNA-binding domain-containing protein [Desulfurococcales archaeon]|nr:AbrB/MazE/SpoVT family DNA-binding domain-containing protein [Desulfurococcales archaeon]
MTRMSALVKVDSKGRITIPQPLREALGIDTGMYVVLLADVERGEILVSPVASRSHNIYEFEIEFKDEPGALAKILNVFAKHNADIIASKCASIMRGETAGCTIIVDFERAKVEPDTVLRELEKLDITNIVKYKKFETY